MTDSRPRTIARRTNHRQRIARLLTEVATPDQLIYELIQNADDSGAESVRFVFSDYALTVTNDKAFTTCSDPTESWDCSYGREEQSCDFHRIREVQNAEKTFEDDTTGAFGVGFNAVYRVTDSPVLISAGRHWTFRDYESNPSDIIEICGGDCDDVCGRRSGTTFILPWATEAETGGRLTFEVPHVTPKMIGEYEEGARSSASMALLFSRHLREISVATLDETPYIFSKTRIDDKITFSLPQGASERWRILEGNFSARAAMLRKSFPESFRRSATKPSTVEVAVREDDNGTAGLVHATFPTRQKTYLPVHINAEVFPDEARLNLLTKMEKGAWNKAAMARAGGIIAEEIVTIRDALDSPFWFWEIVNASWIADSREADELGLTLYWRDHLRKALLLHKIIWAESEQWCRIDDVRCRHVELASDTGGTDDDLVVAVLGRLGIETVHRQIWQESAEGVLADLNVKELKLSDLASSLERSEVVDGFEEIVGGKPSVLALWRECNRLIKDTKGEVLREIALWPATDGSYMPATELLRAEGDPTTLRLVQELGLDMIFLSEDMPKGLTKLRGVVREVTLLDMIATLESSVEGDGGELVEMSSSNRRKLFRWILDRREEIEGDSSLKSRLRSLPLYPTGVGARPLEGAYLPTNFDDPLGIAVIVNKEGLEETEELLETLDVESLNFETYCTVFLPEYFENNDVDFELRRMLVRELSNRYEAVSNDQSVCDALRTLEIIECVGSGPKFLAAGQVYFESSAVTEVLRSEAPVAVEPSSSEIGKLLEELGVTDKPRFFDVATAVAILSKQKHTADGVLQIKRIIKYLADEWPTTSDLNEMDEPDGSLSLPLVYAGFEESLKPLKELRWLPMVGSSEWWRPSEVSARINEHLFESTGSFLDLPKETQAYARNLLDWIGVQIKPTVSQVINHLLQCSGSDEPVNKKVYEFLDKQVRNAGTDEMGRRKWHPDFSKLDGQPCLLNLSEVESIGSSNDSPMYLAARNAYLVNPALGRYRHQLDAWYQDFPVLLDALGVKESPDSKDVELLLREIADCYESGVSLDPEDKEIVERCWKILAEALDEVEAPAGEGGRANLSRILTRIGQNRTYFDLGSVLTRPDRLVINDSPKRAEYVKQLSEAGNSLVESTGYANALVAAGIRSLSRDLKFDLVVQQDELEPDDSFAELLKDRTGLIIRVLFHHEVVDARVLVEDFVKRVEVDRASELRARLRIHKVFDPSVPVSITAILENPKHNEWNLKYADGGKSENGEVPWPHIAGEIIAKLTNPYRKHAIPSITAVLEAKSVRDAERILHDYEVPPLREVRIAGVQSPVASATSLVNPAEDDTAASMGESRHAEEDSTDGDIEVSGSKEGKHRDMEFEADTGSGSPEDSADDFSQRDPELLVEGTQLIRDSENCDPVGECGGGSSGDNHGALSEPEELDAGSGFPGARRQSAIEMPDTREGMQLPEDTHRAQVRDTREHLGRRTVGTGHGTPPVDRGPDERSSSSTGGSRLSGLVYVSGSDGNELSDESTNKAIGKEGELRVVALESRQRRFAKRMDDPHGDGNEINHPGYDIESESKDTGEVRYIEVKTTEGEWGNRGVYLTRRQFETARSHGPMYWLYVVEFLGDARQSIFMIQDPASMLDRFSFNGGWKAFAEVAGEDPASQTF